MLLDDTVDLVGFLLRIAAFFRDESCGQCVPCRVGTVRQEEALRRLASNGDSAADDLAVLAELGQVMRDASICGLGQTASSGWNPPSPDSGLWMSEAVPVGVRDVSSSSASTTMWCGRPRAARSSTPAVRSVERSRHSATATRSPRRARAGVRRGVGGIEVLVPACSRKVEAGMIVRTDTERARLSRRLVLELLGSSVDLRITPDVARWNEEYGAAPDRFGPPADAARRDGRQPGHHHPPDGQEAANVHQPVTVDNDLYVRDYGKCILYKCVDALRRPVAEHPRSAWPAADSTPTSPTEYAGAAHGLGVRLLRELHRRLPNGCTRLQERIRNAGGPARGTSLDRHGPTPSARTAGSAATSRSTCRTTRSSRSRLPTITRSPRGTSASKAASGSSTSRVAATETSSPGRSLPGRTRSIAHHGRNRRARGPPRAVLTASPRVRSPRPSR